MAQSRTTTFTTAFQPVMRWAAVTCVTWPASKTISAFGMSRALATSTDVILEAEKRGGLRPALSFYN